ncbi:hypothetical protein J4H92_04065 [Leucobacter weissii]|uniref:HTH luxR-type domain-containing protein n=1 Tax=Leucobacter weissii TaxID=1983706 RepID=A0A939SB78_9MICO|nr:LuxR C-terminal-related transcriptional regulator [Leucobacter weissii]MBO1901123.1 hypothetical protein [Leucobacter weissii]
MRDAPSPEASGYPSAPALRRAEYPSERVWQRHFAGGPSLPEIRRPNLIRRALDASVRWASVSGAPGTGRTTLLNQICAELALEGESFHAFWTARRAGVAYDALFRGGSRGLAGLARWLDLRAAENPSGTFTVLIDDFDLLAPATHQAALEALLEAVPRLRVVTTTIDPLSAASIRLDDRRFMQFPADALLFSYEETRDLCDLVLERATSREPRGARRLTEDEMRAVFVATRGFPLGVALAVDRIAELGEWSEAVFAQQMQAVFAHILRIQSLAHRRSGFSELIETFSLMPRFTLQHIAICLPGIAPDAVEALEAFPACDTRHQTKAGEYVWSEEFWHAAVQRNSMKTLARRELAVKLYESNEVGAAFEQWFLAGDLAQAEAVLRARFLTVYETLSPEVARGVQEASSARLRDFPLLRAVQMLLDPHASREDLRVCAENLSKLGAKQSATAPMMLAVRAAVLARKRLVVAAREQAERVLRELERPLEEEPDDQTLFSRAEAALTATLALFACGTIPHGMVSLPHAGGSVFLGYRRLLAQQLLDRVRRAPTLPEPIRRLPEPYSYRALIFSGATCVREASAMERVDRAFDDVLGAVRRDAPAEGSLMADIRGASGYPRIFGTFVEGLGKLLSGNLEGAMETAYRAEAPEPSATVLRAIVLLASGRERDALSQIESIEDGWGERVEADRSVLRASARLRCGRLESARMALLQAEHLPQTALVQALTYLTPSDVDDLVALVPSFGPLRTAATLAGALGSGETLGEGNEFQALTDRERLVLEELREGLNTREIAEKHFLSINTVRTHVRSIGKKLDASGQAEMLRRAEQLMIFQRPLAIG